MNTNRPFYNEFKSATPKIKEAWSFALRAHEHQKYGAVPYSKHLEDVVNCLERFGFRPELAKDNTLVENILCAGWLHDSVEDTSVTTENLKKNFGEEVADIVSRVTDEKANTREERKMLTYPKIRNHFGATTVKLADRISNVEASFLNHNEHFLKYVDEQADFYSFVHVPMLAEPMWNHLRLLTERTFGDKPQPLSRVSLFQMEHADIKISIEAWMENEDLRIEDYAIGSRIKLMNDGDSDYERILSVKKEMKNSVLLALLKERFHGNTAFSDAQEWLIKNGIPYEHWSG